MRKLVVVLPFSLGLALSPVGAAPVDAQQQGCNTCRAAILELEGEALPASSAAMALWPPDTATWELGIAAANAAGEDCDVNVTGVLQDENRDEDEPYSTSPDVEECSNAGVVSTLRLRAERAETGDGRYYHIAFAMDDPSCPEERAASHAVVLVPREEDEDVSDANGGGLFTSFEGRTIACSADE